MIQVVALLAKAGHGKTTVANYMRDHYGCSIVSLASPLKKIAKAVMGFSDEQLYGTQAQKEASDPRYGMSARIFLQRLGTEGIRENLGDLVWCEALARSIAQTEAVQVPSRANAVYVVDDARFPNEAEFVHETISDFARGAGPSRFCGSVLKIVCTDAPPSGNDAHASEAGIDLVKPYHIDETIVSSRKQGIAHLIEQFETALLSPKFGGLRRALASNRP